MQPGDGQRYRGRGLIQTTGRANYREARDDIRKIVPDAPDFEQQPQDLEKFPWALLSAVRTGRAGRSENLPIGTICAVTRAVNGGTNGLDGPETLSEAGKGNMALERLDKSRPVLRVVIAGIGEQAPDRTAGVRLSVVVDGCLANTPSLQSSISERSPADR